ADGLPLIMCTDCGLRRVVRCKSQHKWSLCQIFYCCPLHKRGGSSCPFWYWKEEYVDFLASRGLLPASANTYTRAGSMMVAESKYGVG
uniref:Zinc finger GRF-type domain-containing protein n=1 Tax=Setaria italica TaxID=4555 RepID=K3YDW1_SETIT